MRVMIDAGRLEHACDVSSSSMVAFRRSGSTWYVDDPHGSTMGHGANPHGALEAFIGAAERQRTNSDG